MNNDKKLHFMHIGKTGGASLSYFLEKQFPMHEVCPYFYLRGGPKWISPHTVLKETSEQKLKEYKFFKGHLGWVPRTFFSDDEIETITFLRDPIARTISLYNYFRGNPIFWKDKPMPWHSFDEFIGDPLTAKRGSNPMTKSFCKDLYFQKSLSLPTPDFHYVGMDVTTWVNIDLSSQQMLQLAIKRLHQCAFVGLTEHYDESFQWLCTQYGWLPSQETPKRNTSTKFVRTSDLSKQSLDKIAEMNQLDLCLYQEAVKLFSDRKKNRVFYTPQELKQKISKKKVVNKIKFTFADQIVGDGWDAREGTPSNLFCWSLKPQSSLLFSIKKRKMLLVSIHILHWLLPDFKQTFSLNVNSHPISLSYQKHPDGGLIFSGFIPTKAFHSDSSLLELTFSIPKVICPSTINPESEDTRELGFACKEVGIKPISPLHTLLYRSKHKFNMFKNKLIRVTT